MRTRASCATIGLALAVDARRGDLGDETMTSRIARLVEQPGDDRFAKRESASKDPTGR